MLLELLHADGVSPRRACSTHGGEYASPCPFCGGRDRFRVWPEQGRWWCRQCLKQGDAIQYLREVRGMSFREAAERVGKRVKSPKSKVQSGPHPCPSPAEKSGRGGIRNPDTEAVFSRRLSGAEDRRERSWGEARWRARAEAFVSWAAGNLTANPGMLHWLEEKRGLTAATVRAARLGWNPRGMRRDPKDWGLPERKKPLYLPKGLIIPVWSGDVLGRVKTRLDGRNPKYLTVAGGGADQSWKWWRERFPGTWVRWPCVNGKDPNAMRLAGESVREWMMAGVGR